MTMKQVTMLTLASGLLALAGPVAAQGLTETSLKTYADALTLPKPFKFVMAAYWTNYKHHRRVPFSLSPSGTKAYVAYLDESGSGVHVQAVDPATFKATGTAVTVDGTKEAGGLVAQDDGFALLTNEALPAGTANAPDKQTPVPVLYRYDATGTQKWKTWLGGPTVKSDQGLMAAPDLNGDLVYSNKTGQYATYTVVTAYSGDAQGHFGDAVNYIDEKTGKLVQISGASSAWGCSHNTGIALEAADEAPYASVCAEDQGAIWLNSKGQGMSTAGQKISNEHVTNGAGGESLGGMSGSYSNLARFQGSNAYIFVWVSRGAVDVKGNDWMGAGYTHVSNRTNGRNVAIATLSDKYTLNGRQATSELGAKSGDDQVNWVTKSTTADMSNAHAATFDATHALLTWEEIANPICEFDAMGCRGAFSGSRFQVASSDGKLVGEPLQSKNVTVSGDLVTMPDGRICWPYVSAPWDMSEPVGYSGSTESTTTLSFACMSLGGGGGGAGGGGPSGTSPEVPKSTPPTSAPSKGPPSKGPPAKGPPSSRHPTGGPPTSEPPTSAPPSAQPGGISHEHELATAPSSPANSTTKPGGHRSCIPKRRKGRKVRRSA